MFITNVLAARLLPQEIFGQFTMIRSTMALIGNFINNPLGLSITRKVGEFKDSKNPIVGELIITTFIFSGCVLVLVVVFFALFSDWIISSFFLDTPNFKIALFIGLLILISTNLSFLIQNTLIGLEKFKRITITSGLSTLISVPIIYFLIKEFGLYGALFGVALFFLLDFTFKFLSIIKDITINITQSVKKIFSYSKKLMSFSFPLFLSVVLNSGSFWYSKVIIINMNKNFSGIAVFDAAYQILTIILIITGATTSVALPMLSKAFGENDGKKFNRIFKLNLLINVLIASLIALIFIIFAKQIMLLYGEKYVSGKNILIILSVASVFFSISSILNKFFIANNRVWYILLVSIVSMITLFVVLKMFISLNILGLTLAISSYYIAAVIMYILIMTIRKNEFKIG